jgi:hypothetical protein
VIFGWLSVAHLFSFLCCDFWYITTQKTKKVTNTQPTKITTQKTKKVSNTQPTKNHNTENKKGEQHSTN